MKASNYSLLIICIVTFLSCDKMDSSFEDYIVPGGIDYPGKVLLPKAYPGKNRVKLSWIPSADPTIQKTTIYWDNAQDSLELKVTEIDRSQDTVHVFINDLPERSSNSFVLINYNAEGVASVPVELITNVYGQSYQDGIRNRPLIKSLISGLQKRTSIIWDDANITNGAYAVTIKYTDTSNIEINQTFPITQDTTIISGMKGASTYEYRTAYLPEASIDTFYTSYEKNRTYYLDKSGWNVASFSTNHPGDENKVQNFIDDSPATRWHTEASSSVYPHDAVIDMGGEYTLTNFELYRMQGDDRAPDVFRLWASNDTVNWSELDEFNFDRLTDQAQLFEIAVPVKARYFKFEGISGPQSYMVMGEISVKYIDNIPEW